MLLAKVHALWPKGGCDVGEAVSVKANYAFGDWPPQRDTGFTYEDDKPMGGQPEPPLEIYGWQDDGGAWHYESSDE